MAGLTISVKGDARKLVKHAEMVSRTLAPKASIRALNRTMSWTRTRAKREGAAEIKVAVGVVNKRFKSHRATLRSQNALLRFLSGGINAGSLKPKQNKRKGGGTRAGRHYFPGAFVAKGRNDNQCVFKRRGPNPQPIRAIKISTGPVVQRLDRIVANESRARYKLEFERDLNARIKGFAPR